MATESKQEPESTQKESKSLTIRLSWKTLAIVLIVVVIALAGYIVYLKPWQNNPNPRTMSITGESSLKRAPDSFVFYASFEEDSLEAVTAKTNEVVTAVKALGLGDAGIQTNVSNYEKYGVSGPTGETTHTSMLTLSVEDKDLAQKIQDYLVTSGAIGQITPNVGFTKETQKQLRDEATAKAVEDAKKRAEQTAQNLGVKVVRVVKITEPDELQDIYPIASMEGYDASMASSLPINAGESEFTYKVDVEFEIR